MNLSKYIKNHKVLSQYNFIIVYSIMIELLKDGVIKLEDLNVSEL